MPVERIESPPVKNLVTFEGAKAARLPKVVATKTFVRWLGNLVTEIHDRPTRKAHVALTAQAASIALTPLPLGELPPGVWRISLTVRVTQAATTNSSIQATVHWTDGAVVQTESTSALAGNATTTRESLTVVARIDNDTPISYSTTYASAGATPMHYSLDIVAEQLALDATNE